MPTYDYVCKACAHEFEHFQSITAKLLRKCPVCGKNALKRLIGIGAGVIFKGSGFYETDYRSSSYKKAAKAERDAAGGSSDSSKSKASKSDSKSDGPSATSGDSPATSDGTTATSGATSSGKAQDKSKP